MTKFRQVIHPGDVGLDVFALKRTLRQLGYKKIVPGRTAGKQFVQAIRTTQLHHNLAGDGIVGPSTFKLLEPHMDKYSRYLYTHAAMRSRPLPGTAQAAARRLLELHAHGKYNADNPGDLRDIQATAAGSKVWSALGRSVAMDRRVLQLLVYLIDEKGFRIGTFALCSDHHNDGPHGHSGGFAVDISTINGVSIRSTASQKYVLQVLEAIHAAPAHLRVRQLISGGYGLSSDSACQALCIPNAAYYGWTTLSEHENHIHVGY